MRRPAGLALLIAVTLLMPAVPVAAATPPSVQPPVVQLNGSGGIRYGKLPLTVSWSAATPGDAPVDRYQLQRRVDGLRWARVSLPSRRALSVNLRIRPWAVAEFRLRAIDTAGNRSAWAAADPVWLAASQESDTALTLSSGWQLLDDRKSFGGRRATTTGDGETARFEFLAREVAWVAARRVKGGQADVYVDDVFAERVDLASNRLRPRKVVFREEWEVAGAHTLEIRSVGGGVVDIDALLTMTPPAVETLVGAGDISRCTNDGDSQTAAVIAGVDGIVYTTGDNVYLNGTAEEFATCYEPTWGAFKERTRPVPGNHDYGTPGAAPYFEYFGANAGQPGKGWYRYQAGTWRVYALNSECAHVGGCDAGSEQYDWLQADLAAEPHRCVLAYWHRARFSSGPHGSSAQMSNIYELLYNHGADLVLVGHDHTYERMAKARADGTPDPARGVRQIVVGTGGSALYGFKDEIHPLSQARQNSTHGVLRVDLSAGSYSWQYLPVDGGTFTDSGTTACH